MAARILPGDQERQLEGVFEASCGSSRAAAKAATTFLRWSAFWKIPYERSCEVDAAPPRAGRASPVEAGG
jgi:hypothetical protein